MRPKRPHRPRKPRTNPHERIRYQEDVGTVRWEYWHPTGPNGPWCNVLSQSYTQVRKYDRLVGYTGARSLWNPVSHQRIRGRGGEWTPCFYVEPAGFVHLTPIADGLRPLPVSVADLLSLRPTLKPSVLRAIQSRAMTRSALMVPSGTSVANFLIELREGLKGIVPSLKKFKDLLGNLYLGIKFGLESFLRDLVGLYKTWGAYQKRLQWLRKHNGACDNWVRESRKDFEITDFDVVPDRIWYPYHDELGTPIHLAVKLHVVPESVSARVHVNVLVYFLLKGLETFWGKMDAFSAAFGLNNPCKIAWNAARMSWLVEYFVNVSPYLDQLAGKPFKGEWEIRSVWSSVKVTYMVEVFEGRLTGEPGGEPGDYWPPEPSGRYVVRTYDRYPGVDLTEEELINLGLTDQQKTIVLALGESRLKWDRTPWTKWAVRKWGPWQSGGRPRLRFNVPPRWFRKRFPDRRARPNRK